MEDDYSMPMEAIFVPSSGNASDLATDYHCSGASAEELKLFGVASWWVGGVIQASVCLIGLMANIVSIPVLYSKALFKSTFNRLLIILALCDNIYLVFAFLESIRHELQLATNVHTIVFVYLLYPLHNFILCVSIYMTTVIAVERYRAVSQPIDYHAIMVSGRQWQRVSSYVVPVFLFSAGFNIPKFFELTTQTYTYNVSYTETEGKDLNLSDPAASASPLYDIQNQEQLQQSRTKVCSVLSQSQEIQSLWERREERGAP